MKRSTRSLLFSAIVVAVALVAHFVLIRVLAETQVVATLFACGEHTPTGTVVLAISFMVVRLFVAMLLPGVVLSAVGAWAIERWAERREAPARPTEKTAE